VDLDSREKPILTTDANSPSSQKITPIQDMEMRNSPHRRHIDQKSLKPANRNTGKNELIQPAMLSQSPTREIKIEGIKGKDRSKKAAKMITKWFQLKMQRSNQRYNQMSFQKQPKK